ncbi:hypothetical protein [Fodinicurvata sediminis]|uniref:hypothetical protein n=1 Tax=Fodinicurvata sediminis TaxID=1121832 RepID=UPI0003B53706|nr:hypothetical protein [Fodinicurvata sediminis]
MPLPDEHLRVASLREVAPASSPTISLFGTAIVRLPWATLYRPIDGSAPRWCYRHHRPEARHDA